MGCFLAKQSSALPFFSDLLCLAIHAWPWSLGLHGKSVPIPWRNQFPSPPALLLVESWRKTVLFFCCSWHLSFWERHKNLTAPAVSRPFSCAFLSWPFQAQGLRDKLLTSFLVFSFSDFRRQVYLSSLVFCEGHSRSVSSVFFFPGRSNTRPARKVSFFFLTDDSLKMAMSQERLQ